MYIFLWEGSHVEKYNAMGILIMQWEMNAWLEKFGYSHEQAYMLMATAPIKSRILAVPNIPTANVSVGLPVQIFDFDIQPTAAGPHAQDRGSGAYLTEERERSFLTQSRIEGLPFDRPQ